MPVLLALLLAGPSLFAQGTAFTYQGRLTAGNAPAKGLYDLRFAIYDSTDIPGNLLAGPVTTSATAIGNGLFTVVLDFGSGVFNGVALAAIQGLNQKLAEKEARLQKQAVEGLKARLDKLERLLSQRNGGEQ